MAAIVALLAAPGFALAAGVSVKLDFSSPSTIPFPSDRFTRVDWTQNTFKRVQLPKPDCAARPSDCADIDVINTLDGFNTQPRITVPFTGDIDPTSVTSETVYLVNLGDTLSGLGFGHKVGVNQVSWESSSKTLVFESDELLDEHSRYVLVVTNGVRDAAGDPVEAGRFGRFREQPGLDEWRDRELMDYRKSLLDGEHSARSGRHRIAALSLFTTQSIGADLHKIARQIKLSQPAPVTFMIGNGGSTRAMFPAADLRGIQFHRQTGTTAAGFTDSFVPTPALDVVRGSVATVAFGKFTSPDYQNAFRLIPATPTLTGQPQPFSSNELVFELFLPSGAKPPGGWPVAIFGHGFSDSIYGGPWAVASVFASKGIATIAINAVGHGGGSQGTLNVISASGRQPVTVPAGGRGFDQDGNGVIGRTEGLYAAAPASIVADRDGLRQTVVDLMQLVRQIEVGIDVDGDGHADLDMNRIYYAGQSFDGMYGTVLMGVEDGIKAGVLNVAGGSSIEVNRLGLGRLGVAIVLYTRQPQLLNLPPTPGVPFPFNLNFNENLPLRDLPVVINTVPGATDIQQVGDHYQWVQQSGNPVSYASGIRKNPPRGHAAKPVIFQFAKGDVTVPNPTTSAILRAGGLADRATFFRNDLAYLATGGAIPKNPHTFLTNIGIAAAAPFAVAAQLQIATFFASDGTLVIDPDGADPIFEMPIALPLPEGLNFLP